MAVVRLEAFRALQRAIEAAIPGLEIVLVQKASGAECLPNLVITPVRFRYIPDQEEIVFEPDNQHIVLNVGRHEGTIQFRIAATNLQKRYELEQALLDVFLGWEGHPGVLSTQVTACPSLGNFLASWELEDDEWDNAKTFDNRYESVLVITGIIPALVTRGGVPTVQQLQFGLTADFEKTFTPTTFTAANGVELVQITESGTIAAIT